MTNYLYVPEEYYNYLSEYMYIDNLLVDKTKDFIRDALEKFKLDNTDFTLYTKHKTYNKKQSIIKIKVFTEKNIYVFILSCKINNLYTIWYKDTINIIH